MPAPRAIVSFISLFLWAGIACVCAEAQTGSGGASEIHSFSTITSAAPLPNGIELHDGALMMRVTALRDDVLRIRAHAQACCRKMHRGRCWPRRGLRPLR